jgi:hypothetical protein
MIRLKTYQKKMYYNIINMTVINIHNLFNKKDTLIRDEILEYLDYSQKMTDSILLSDKNSVKLVNFLIVDTYNFNIYHSFVGFKLLTSNDNEFWNMIDDKMNNSINLMFQNEKLYTKLVSIINNHECNKKYVGFLTKIVDKFLKRGINNNKNRIKNINGIIKNNEKQIIRKLTTFNKINIDKSIFENNKKGKIQVKLNRGNYFYLLNSIKDADTRSKIEKVYNSKVNTVLNDMCKIIILRKYYAKELGYVSFFNYSNNIITDTYNIKELIDDLLEKASDRTFNEIKNIHSELIKDGYNKKVDRNDIIYYHRKFESDSLFKPSDVFVVLFKTINKYFGIKFVNITHEKWNENVMTLLCIDSETGKKLGILYLDITYSDEKKIEAPLFIKLCDKFTINSKTMMSHICILGNYKDINSKCMDYNNVVLMFKEFGHVIRNLLYKSNTGLNNYNNLYDNFLPYVMEYIAWDKNIIRDIVGNKNIVGGNEEIVDHILFSRNIDLCYSITQRCIYALIDYTIHSSDDFTNKVNDSIKNSKTYNKTFMNLCKDLIRNKTQKFSSVLNIDNCILPPHFYIHMISGSGGILYSNISNEILSYAIYKSIINGDSNRFKSSVLECVDKPFNILLLDYISEINVDAYNLYLKDVIGVDNNIQNDECDIMTDNTNFFDDKDSDSDDNIDNHEILKF